MTILLGTIGYVFLFKLGSLVLTAINIYIEPRTTGQNFFFIYAFVSVILLLSLANLAKNIRYFVQASNMYIFYIHIGSGGDCSGLVIFINIYCIKLLVIDNGTLFPSHMLK
jgi:phosphoglycerol transferase MdoB-like AlkP superfamily enzyme